MEVQSKSLEIRNALLPQMFVDSFDKMEFESDVETRKFLDGCVESPDSCLIGYDVTYTQTVYRKIIQIEFQFDTKTINWYDTKYYGTTGPQGTFGRPGIAGTIKGTNGSTV